MKQKPWMPQQWTIWAFVEPNFYQTSKIKLSQFHLLIWNVVFLQTNKFTFWLSLVWSILVKYKKGKVTINSSSCSTVVSKSKMSKTRVSIPFSQRGPIPIHLEDTIMGEYFHLKIFKSFTNHKRNESNQTIHLLIGTPTGCSVIDVIFPQGEEISEVRFKYVDSLCFVKWLIF